MDLIIYKKTNCYLQPEMAPLLPDIKKDELNNFLELVIQVNYNKKIYNQESLDHKTIQKYTLPLCQFFPNFFVHGTFLASEIKNITPNQN
jgi:hypothetical protein